MTDTGTSIQIRTAILDFLQDCGAASDERARGRRSCRCGRIGPLPLTEAAGDRWFRPCEDCESVAA